MKKNIKNTVKNELDSSMQKITTLLTRLSISFGIAFVISLAIWFFEDSGKASFGDVLGWSLIIGAIIYYFLFKKTSLGESVSSSSEDEEKPKKKKSGLLKKAAIVGAGAVAYNAMRPPVVVPRTGNGKVLGVSPKGTSSWIVSIEVPDRQGVQKHKIGRNTKGFTYGASSFDVQWQ